MIKLNGIYPPLKFLAYTIINILIAYIIFGICRLVFFITNIEYFPNLGIENIIQIIKGGVEAFLYAFIALLFIVFLKFTFHPILDLIFTTIIYVISLVVVVLIFDNGIRKVFGDFLKKRFHKQ